MNNPDYEIRRGPNGKGYRIGSLDAKKRGITQLAPLALSKKFDNSSHLGVNMYDKVDLTSVSGAPAMYNVFLTNNNTSHVTPANCIVNLNIPIIPVVWDTDSPEDLEDFVKNGRESSINQKRFEQMDEATARMRKDEYAAEIENYILFEFGMAYSKALKDGDQNAAEIISGLDMMKDFDLELCNDIINGNVKTVTPNSLPFIKSFKQYIKTKDKFKKLTKTIEDYVYHDVDRAINGESFMQIYGDQPE